jgi:hypothetical protein
LKHKSAFRKLFKRQIGSMPAILFLTNLALSCRD